jgi:hypothetical protein
VRVISSSRMVAGALPSVRSHPAGDDLHVPGATHRKSRISDDCTQSQGIGAGLCAVTGHPANDPQFGHTCNHHGYNRTLRVRETGTVAWQALMDVQLSARLTLLSGRCTMLSTWRGVSLSRQYRQHGQPLGGTRRSFERAIYPVLPVASQRRERPPAVLNVRTAVRTGTHNPH